MAIRTVGPTGEFATIADAMAAPVNPGDIIQLQAGYTGESATVTVNNLTFNGDATNTGIALTLSLVSSITLTGTAPISVQGDSGDNTITGNDGANALNGGDGNDTLRGGDGADILDGGAGSDFADYSGIASTAVVADLNNPENNTGSAAGDSYTSIEHLRGSNEGDQLRGGAGTNILIGGDGNDFLRGRGGADVLNGEAGTDWADYAGENSNSVTADLASPGSDRAPPPATPIFPLRTYAAASRTISFGATPTITTCAATRVRTCSMAVMVRTRRATTVALKATSSSTWRGLWQILSTLRETRSFPSSGWSPVAATMNFMEMTKAINSMAETAPIGSMAAEHLTLPGIRPPALGS